MSRQYMDFAPRKAARPVVKTAVHPVKKTVRPVAKVTARAAAHPMTQAAARPVARTARPATRAMRSVTKTGVKKAVTREQANFSVKQEPKLGVIEDLNPKFVNTNVPKRPLGEASHFRAQKTGVAAVKAKKIGLKSNPKSAEKPVGNSKKNGVGGTYSLPKSPFINQGKVQKRPLSKNVYQKKVVTPKEEPKGPVTIISKPEKQAHTGLIVTIILTIILGAAAGTMAFLLLPK